MKLETENPIKESSDQVNNVLKTMTLESIDKLRYFNLEPCFKLQWCHARDLFRSQIPVIAGEFELRIICIQSSYL